MKFLRGSTDGCIMFNDVVRERDGALLRQTFQDETSPAITVYGSICRPGGGQNAISRGGAGKDLYSNFKISFGVHSKMLHSRSNV